VSCSRRPSLTIVVVPVLLLGGCGGGDETNSSSDKKAPPAKEVQATVSTLLEKCISASFDANADTNDVSIAVDKQIRFFKGYDPDAPLGPSDLKAKTMRQVLEQTRETLGRCKPEDVDRVSQALTSK
jgi:major membrane immunogen (membrane-anchored lipoprotein)